MLEVILAINLKLIQIEDPQIISYRCVRQVKAGNQTQETDECQPSLKRNQVVKDTAQKKIAVIIPLIKCFSVF